MEGFIVVAIFVGVVLYIKKDKVKELVEKAREAIKR